MHQALLISLLSFFLIACDNQNPVKDDSSMSKGELSFSIDMTQAPTDVVSLKGILERSGNDTVFFDFDLADTAAVAKVENLIVGEWRLTVEALNEDSQIIYSGSTEVIVESGKTTTVYLHLNPTTGDLRIIVTWGNADPVAYYPFDGNANDESGNQNHGEIFEAILTEDRFGVENSAYLFDGIDDYINLGNPKEFDFDKESFTISLWFKSSASRVQQQLIRKGFNTPLRGVGRWVLTIDSTNVLRIIIEDNFHSGFLYSFGKIVVTDGNWHHLVLFAERDNSLKVYIDEQLDINDSSLKYFDGPILTNNIVSYIGRDYDPQSYFKGKIDDIIVWRRIVSFDEINKYW